MGRPASCSGRVTSHRTAELEEALELILSRTLTPQTRDRKSKGLEVSQGHDVSVTGLG